MGITRSKLISLMATASLAQKCNYSCVDLVQHADKTHKHKRCGGRLYKTSIFFVCLPLGCPSMYPDPWQWINNCTERNGLNESSGILGNTPGFFFFFAWKRQPVLFLYLSFSLSLFSFFFFFFVCFCYCLGIWFVLLPLTFLDNNLPSWHRKCLCNYHYVTLK